MMNPNSKFPKYSTQRLTTAVVPANYCILSIGQGMRVLTKKLLGYLLLNSDTLPNLSQTFTLHTQPNLALCQIFPNSDLQPPGVLHFFEDHTCFFYVQNILISFYCRVISTSHNASGSTSRTPSGTTSGFFPSSFPVPFPILLLCLLTTNS